MPSLPKLDSAAADIESRWNAALNYFRSRRAVVFLSQSRFWERHAFAQQSLAKYLVRYGVEVTWLDGFGWRHYQPTLYFDSPLLQVRQIPQLPGCRFPSVERAARHRQERFLSDLI